MNTQSTAVTPIAERQGIVAWAASHFGVDAGKVLPILKATCFKGADNKEASDAEVAALLIVAREHKLNPFLKEIYAFPSQRGGIVPIVGIDGWISIVNGHPAYSGVEFAYEGSPVPAWIECHIFRTDRTHPIKVRELLNECKRDTGPWKSHPSRMLRHKAFIQCARVAFGFAGIYDEDEGERIVEGSVVHEQQPQHQQRGAAGLKAALDVPEAPEKTVGALEQRDSYVAKLKSCTDTEILALTMDEARGVEWSPADQAVLDDAYSARMAALSAQGS